MRSSLVLPIILLVVAVIVFLARTVLASNHPIFKGANPSQQSADP